MPNTKEPITIESVLRKFVHSCYIGCTKSELEILRQEAELALSPLEQSENKEEITFDTFKQLGFERNGIDHLRKFGTCVVTLRLNAGHCYCELPNLYIGEIENLTRLKSLLFGLTGREEFKALPSPPANTN